MSTIGKVCKFAEHGHSGDNCLSPNKKSPRKCPFLDMLDACEFAKGITINTITGEPIRLIQKIRKLVKRVKKRIRGKQ